MEIYLSSFFYGFLITSDLKNKTKPKPPTNQTTKNTSSASGVVFAAACEIFVFPTF